MFPASIDKKKSHPAGQKKIFKTFCDITTFGCNEKFWAWTDNKGTLFNISIAIVKF